jgi:hypothetical protein
MLTNFDYITHDEPISLYCGMEKYSEIASLISLSSKCTYCFKFHMNKYYCEKNNFLVYPICITCDNIVLMKLEV